MFTLASVNEHYVLLTIGNALRGPEHGAAPQTNSGTYMPTP